MSSVSSLYYLHNMRHLRGTTSYGIEHSGFSIVLENTVMWNGSLIQMRQNPLEVVSLHLVVVPYLEINQINKNWVRVHYSGNGWLCGLVVEKSHKQICLWNINWEIMW